MSEREFLLLPASLTPDALPWFFVLYYFNRFFFPIDVFSIKQYYYTIILTTIIYVYSYVTPLICLLARSLASHLLKENMSTAFSVRSSFRLFTYILQFLLKKCTSTQQLKVARVCMCVCFFPCLSVFVCVCVCL